MTEFELRDTLAMNIKTLRSCRNWTQADLAEKTGLSIVFLSDIERGNKWPYLDTMLRIANAFKIEVFELLKPYNTPDPEIASAIAKLNEEVNSILTKNFQNAEKNTIHAISTLFKLHSETGAKDSK